MFFLYISVFAGHIGGTIMAEEINQPLGMRLRKKDDLSTLIELSNGEVILGRSAECTIVIEDSTVSARHARIYTYLTVSYIEDLDSSNGTFINELKIQKHILKPDDIIRLGKYQLLIDKPHVESISKKKYS